LSVSEISANRLLLQIQPQLREQLADRLQAGEVLNARVLQVLSEQSAVVRLKGLDVTALLPFAPRAGDAFTARVEQLRPDVVLTLVSPLGERVNEGELVEVVLRQRLADGQGLFEVRGATVKAEVPPGMAPGERLLARVSQLAPQITLEVLRPGEAGELAVIERLKELLPDKRPLPRALANLMSTLEAYAGARSGQGAASAIPAGAQGANTSIDTLIRVIMGGGAQTPDDSMPGGARSLLNLSAGARSLLTLLAGGLLSEGEFKQPETARHIVRQSGFTWENEVRNLAAEQGRDSAGAQARAAQPQPPDNLKTALLKVFTVIDRLVGARENLRGAGPAELELLNTAYREGRQALSSLEAGQLENILNRRDTGQLNLTIPYWTSEGEVASLQMLIRRREEKSEGRGKEGEEKLHVVFLLNLQGLGDLRIDALFRGQNVSITFHSHDQARADFIAAALPELEERLAEAEFQVVDKASLVSQRVKEQRLKAEDGVLFIGAENMHMIDIKV